MDITIDSLFNGKGSDGFIKSVADRSLAVERNKILITNYLSFESTPTRLFKSLYGTTSAVRMGSVIDRNANKPVRGRSPMGEATLEVAYLGDRFQMDNDRLEQLNDLLKRANASASPASFIAEEVTNFLVQDFRELTIAPYKRMEKVLFDLIYNSTASVTVSDNPKGVQLLDMNLPINVVRAKGSDKGHLVDFLVNVRNQYGHLSFSRMEMSQATYLKHIGRNAELLGKYKVSQGNVEVSITGTVPVSAVNPMFESIGLPPIRIVSNKVVDLAGKETDMCPEDKIVFLPEGELGKLRHYSTLESVDPVPGKVYTSLKGSHLISSFRTEEGRFLEYGCAWIPEIRLPKSIISVDLTAIK